VSGVAPGRRAAEAEHRAAAASADLGDPGRTGAAPVVL